MRKTQILSAGIAGLLLILLMLLASAPYGWRTSSLLRIGEQFGRTYHVPQGTVLFPDGGYDGEYYYQIARNTPQFLFGEQSRSIPFFRAPYRYQRILYSVFASILSLWNDALLPFAMVLINLSVLLASVWLLTGRAGKTSIHVLAVALSPAGIVGFLYSLTEPLSILFLIVFLLMWERNDFHIRPLHLLPLVLSLFTRETTLFLIAPLLLFCMIRKEWKQAALLLLPLALFAFWQWVLWFRFGELPLETGAGKLGMPLVGIVTLFQWVLRTPTAKHLSSVVFLLCFIIPLAALTLGTLRRNLRDPLPWILTGLLVFLVSMAPFIWGVITSVGRVVTPLYPVYALTAIRYDSRAFQAVSAILIAIGLIAGTGMALSIHPFVLA